MLYYPNTRHPQPRGVPPIPSPFPRLRPKPPQTPNTQPVRENKAFLYINPKHSKIWVQEAAGANPVTLISKPPQNKASAPIHAMPRQPKTDDSTPIAPSRRSGPGVARPGNIPAMSRHGYSARVRLSGIDVYLGPWGSPQAQAAYDDAIARWIGSGRMWPPSPAARGAEPLTLRALCEAHLGWAASYYVKAGRVTPSYVNIERALSLLFYAGLGEVAPISFGPTHLKAFRDYMLLHPAQAWGRKTINEYTRNVVQLFRWGAEEELIPAEVATALALVRRLRKGRAPAAGLPVARDGRKVEPVPEAVLEATLRHARPMLAAMIRVQLYSLMRPGELVTLRPCDLVPTKEPGVFVYHVGPGTNKTEHYEIPRQVFLGPKALAEIRPWLPSDPMAYIFSPKRALEAFNAARRAARTSKRWPSHSAEARKARKEAANGEGSPAAPVGDRYTTASYRKAIARACELAYPHPTLSKVPRSRRTPEQRAELKAWQAKHTWHPHQLRHNAATSITEHESLEVARIMLGHQSIATTLIYAKVHDRRAILAALRRG